jgi:hypothetical protein
MERMFASDLIQLAFVLVSSLTISKPVFQLSNDFLLSDKNAKKCNNFSGLCLFIIYIGPA